MEKPVRWCSDLKWFSEQRHGGLQEKLWRVKLDTNTRLVGKNWFGDPRGRASVLDGTQKVIKEQFYLNQDMSLEPARKSVVFSRTWGMGARELKLIGKSRGFFGSRGTIGRQSISSLNSESLLLHIVNWSLPETARTGVKDQFLPVQGLGGWRFFARKGNYRRGCRQGCIRRRKSREA